MKLKDNNIRFLKFLDGLMSIGDANWIRVRLLPVSLRLKLERLVQSGGRGDAFKLINSHFIDAADHKT